MTNQHLRTIAIQEIVRFLATLALGPSVPPQGIDEENEFLRGVAAGLRAPECPIEKVRTAILCKAIDEVIAGSITTETIELMEAQSKLFMLCDALGKGKPASAAEHVAVEALFAAIAKAMESVVGGDAHSMNVRQTRFDVYPGGGDAKWNVRAMCGSSFSQGEGKSLAEALVTCAESTEKLAEETMSKAAAGISRQRDATDELRSLLGPRSVQTS